MKLNEGQLVKDREGIIVGLVRLDSEGYWIEGKSWREGDNDILGEIDDYILDKWLPTWLTDNNFTIN